MVSYTSISLRLILAFCKASGMVRLGSVLNSLSLYKVMPKGRTRPEIYLLFFSLQLTPKEIIKKYKLPRNTIYSYHSRYQKEVLPRFKRLMKSS